jgi:hypothetical protein
MEVAFAQNFNDYVAVMVASSPHALVMDWWRRLDLALREYFTLRRVVGPANRRTMDQENFAGLAGLNRALIGRAEAMDSSYRTILDMDSTEIDPRGKYQATGIPTATG